MIKCIGSCRQQQQQQQQQQVSYWLYHYRQLLFCAFNQFNHVSIMQQHLSNTITHSLTPLHSTTHPHHTRGNHEWSAEDLESRMAIVSVSVTTSTTTKTTTTKSNVCDTLTLSPAPLNHSNHAHHALCPRADFTHTHTHITRSDNCESAAMNNPTSDNHPPALSASEQHRAHHITLSVLSIADSSTRASECARRQPNVKMATFIRIRHNLHPQQ